ncbi:FkbM family methyltransferase [Fibrella arboris]|uniref:FkbM family methyltransferase n=1 Tax=Fibrella arboris TaxID=3242486 RepID=UPI00351FF936
MAIAEISLFNEEPIYCLRPKEATYLAGEVNEYLTHGIRLKPGDTVFDVGANIGMFSLWVCRQCQNDVTVYAFEPIPALVEVLRLNAQRFAPGRLHVMPFGLSHTPHTAPFTFYPKATVWSTAYPGLAYQERGQTKQATLTSLETAPRWVRWVPVKIWSALIDVVLNQVMRKTQTVVCQVRTLSEVIDEQQVATIDLLKVDVEHGELDVLRGMADRHWPMIRQVVMEVHAIEDRLEQVTTLLREQGFSQVITDQQGVLKGTNIYMLYAIR